jgi:putative ABC transport system permease protein
MATVVRGNMKMALSSVRQTKWRSLLTMLGIIIGVVSVVTVVGIGQGVKQDVAGQITQFGEDLITVRPGVVDTDNTHKTITNTDLVFGLNSISGLTERDLRTIQQTEHVRLAAPLSVVPGTVNVDGKKLDNSLVLATNGSLPGALNHEEIKYGEFFKDNQTYQAAPAVIGKNVAEALFDDTVPLGRQFTFRGQTFIVHGVFDDFKGSPLSPTSNFNNAIFIPYTIAEKLTNNSAQMFSILVKPTTSDKRDEAIAAMNTSLLAAHGGQKDFSVLNRDQSLAASSNVLDLLTTMIAAIAAISLLVGGIGIMNIMLVSVTERMHEIGIRKAIGATNRQILGQFMMEATVLSLVGGAIGVAMSLATAFLLSTYTSLHPVISWQSVLIATGVSIAIGIFFGTAPAIKAARKDPIEALRHE